RLIRTPLIRIRQEKVCDGLREASARSGLAITKSLTRNLSVSMRSTQNANAGSTAVESPNQADSFLRAQTQSRHSAHRHFCHWRRRRALDAFCAEVSASGRRDGFRYRLLRCAAHSAWCDLCLPWRGNRGSLGPSARVHHLQRGLNRWLCARPAHSKLGRSDRWNVFLSFMELFFFAGNVLACRRCARSTPPFHGGRRSISDQ